MPKHGSINLYVHGNQKARYDGQPRPSTSTLTQLLNYDTGVERIPKQESAQKVDLGEENSPAAPAGIRTRDLSITSPAL